MNITAAAEAAMALVPRSSFFAGLTSAINFRDLSREKKWECVVTRDLN